MARGGRRRNGRGGSGNAGQDEGRGTVDRRRSGGGRNGRGGEGRDRGGGVVGRRGPPGREGIETTTLGVSTSQGKETDLSIDRQGDGDSGRSNAMRSTNGDGIVSVDGICNGREGRRDDIRSARGDRGLTWW